jgi:GT2 family glycosyltransferase
VSNEVDISVVIVNYNVKHFIEQCLHSVYKAVKNFKVEIFVVDNNSVDGSCPLIKQKFPNVILIENKDNVGFSKANNQAIYQAKGKYVLILNPDTVLQENTLQTCFDFMEQRPDAGSSTVMMIDGKGNFLPESKRGLPTPKVSFFKIFGLTALFPKSKIFGRYYLGHLSKNENHEIEVLPGAFMFTKKEALDKVGAFDENFFMYGEDIDLSYRIQNGGYKNYYIADTKIIHYKGESTKKGSFNYVLIFYKAMIIFAKKHFAKKNAQLYIFFINLAIYLRAFLSLLKRIWDQTILPVLDMSIIYSGFLFFIPFWGKQNFGDESYYPPDFLYHIVPAYVVIWFFSILLSGGYNKPVKPQRAFRGILIGTIFILMAYALLPENLRYSRMLIIIGGVWAMFASLLVRGILSLLNLSSLKIKFVEGNKKILVVANNKESERIEEILHHAEIKSELVGRITIEEESQESIGNIEQLEEVVRVNKIDEIVFGSESLDSEQIMQHMLKFSNQNVDFKIAPPQSFSIIGSNSINTAGELYTVNIESIGKPINRFKKRVFDVVAGIVILILSPVLIFATKRGFYNRLLYVIVGKRTWIGYLSKDTNIENLPKLQKSILQLPFHGLSGTFTDVNLSKINITYAKNYKVSTDFKILVQNLRNI